MQKGTILKVFINVTASKTKGSENPFLKRVNFSKKFLTKSSLENSWIKRTAMKNLIDPFLAKRSISGRHLRGFGEQIRKVE